MVNAKKDSTKKNDNSSPSSLHPPYFQMISEAITTMKDRSGSSQPAIAKFMEVNYVKMLPPNFKKILSIQLKRFVKSEKLVKVKNSYKIAVAEKVKKTADADIVQKRLQSKKETVEKQSAKKVVEKAKRTKRLSQLKTPEALKKTKTAAKMGGEKVKKKAATPAKRKLGGKTMGLSPPAKKAKKK
ncbi:winged-helix DNA-binding transcription factor family protein [Perilla frutescens var. hirtella]|uniref:Winged-helix DNA-binding transcription factor family protein n=1 Tax=Perilla frutescens var. hirtella TaxID=608512 RepID=A0AAD4IYB2_PERFH|nr:winged-helix DNA-binding transcription factor family protein [Perilla frutescens var. hirtella]